VIIIIRGNGSEVTPSYYAQPYPAPAYGESAYESVPIPPAPIYGEQSSGPSVYAGPGYAASVPQYAPATTCYWARGEPAWDGYRWLRRPIRVCN